jgi:hypothetical protein
VDREGRLERRDPVGLTPAEGRKFALTLAVAFGALGGLLWWRGRETPMWVMLGLAGAFFLLGLVVPGRLGPLHRAWMGLALKISKVTTPVFMGALYYLVMTPAGVLRRVIGRNALVHDDASGTYWVDRTDGGARQDMEHQF